MLKTKFYCFLSALICVTALTGCASVSSSAQGCGYKNLTSGRVYASSNIGASGCGDALRQCRESSVYGWRCSKAISA